MDASTILALALGLVLGGLAVAFSAHRARRRERALAAEWHTRAEAAEYRYRTVVEELGDGVLLIGETGEVVTANPSAERMFGAAPGGLIGLPAERLRSRWIAHDGTAAPAELAFDGRAIAALDGGLPRADGTVMWARLSVRPIIDRRGPGPFPMLVSLADVTPQRESAAALSAAHRELERRATDLERSNAELEQFAYVASHDLSEPLRMVTSYLQLLRRRYRGQLDGDADEFIDYAVDGAGRMRDLIDDLLTYSRVGRSASAAEPVDLEAVAAGTLRALAAAAADAGAEVRIGPLPTVVGDEVQLGQLLQNLIANALKFRAPDRPAWVRVSGERFVGGWALAVADNGIGVDPAHEDRIFKMFQRLHTRDAYEGTGIGLAVCRRIVEQHGGRIWLEPTPGGGATFRFTLPDRAPAGAAA
jgi:PAS domain S-box-containing protein